MPKILNKLKCSILQTSFKAGEGHIASAFSILDILWVLYDQILKIDPLKPRDEKRDRFFLSKGHASLGLYAVLAEKCRACRIDRRPRTWERPSDHTPVNAEFVD